MGWFIAGLVLLFIGLVSYFNATTHFLSGPVAGAVVVVIIGIIIILAGLYYASRARSRYPPPT